MRIFKAILACLFLFPSAFFAASDVHRTQNAPQGTLVEDIRIRDRNVQNSGAINPFLSWSTFLGGAKYDYPSGIALDPAGNIYVVGDSQVSWGSPIRPFAGDHEAFVAKLNADGDLQWSTFLGGAGFDMGNGLAVDSSGNVYVAGERAAAWGSPAQATRPGARRFGATPAEAMPLS
ncbi:MAG: SBBP repeat-containing protein [Candidatus Aminicenantes bacterium]|nr:SBBP repeat-containing protein [Candidatus Aminicenantes bacterium]